MQKNLLELQAPISGIYLNTEIIELLSIIQCEDIKELKKIVKGCSQIDISKEEMVNWNDENIDSIKRNIIELYKESLISLEQSVKSKKNVLKSRLEHAGINIDSYLLALENDDYDKIRSKLEVEIKENYIDFAEKLHRFIPIERDQIKSVTYEELCGINEILHNHNTILITSGNYCDIINNMFDDKLKRYDYHYTEKDLDFCYKNKMNVRYHTLLDKHTLNDCFLGKSKKYVLKELKEYVKQSIDFISKYNEEHKINGKGIISSVDLFNEIISFGAPYKNIWEEKLDISTEELVEIFQYAKDKRPKGVKYIYNENFLENPEKRQKVIEQLYKINELSPGLIDTIGTQMHIKITQNIDDIIDCFNDLKKLENIGIRTQITEFDMCLPESLMFNEKGNVYSEKELLEFINAKTGNIYESIAEFKRIKVLEISNAIYETGIQPEGITYWTIIDKLDANADRVNKKTYEDELPRDIVKTMYSGLYSNLEIVKILSSSVHNQINTSKSVIVEQSKLKIDEVNELARAGVIEKVGRELEEQIQNKENPIIEQ